MPGKLSVPIRVAITMVCCAILAPAAMGEGIIKSLPCPGDSEFVRDLAHMLSPEDTREIESLCDELLAIRSTPIIVVTIRSMADHGGRGMRIETFARLLFDQWQIGMAKLNDQSWNTGILLLISNRDRKARIELGAGWKREKDDLCEEIMSELIIPKFKDGEFSAGIVVGVRALDKMARGLKIPKRPWPAWYYVTIFVVLGLGTFTIVSLYNRGSSGYAWLFWSQMFALLQLILYILASSSKRDGFSNASSDGEFSDGGFLDGGFFDGGFFGGGSSGGGFSGGGGATGSW